METQKKRAPAIKRRKHIKRRSVRAPDTLANDIPAKNRFRQAADLALEILSDKSLNFWSWRIEGELKFSDLRRGRSYDEVPAEGFHQWQEIQVVPERGHPAKKAKRVSVAVKRTKPSKEGVIGEMSRKETLRRSFSVRAQVTPSITPSNSALPRVSRFAIAL